MDKVKISNSVNADSRTAIDKTKENLLNDSLKHISEVQQVFNLVAYLMIKQGQQHDYTKLTEFDKFFDDYLNKGGQDFISGEWYNIHITEEKHHSKSKLHEDITLIHIFEEVIDKVVAGKGRTGKVNLEFFNLSDETLRLAFNNTIKLIDSITEIS